MSQSIFTTETAALFLGLKKKHVGDMAVPGWWTCLLENGKSRQVSPGRP